MNVLRWKSWFTTQRPQLSAGGFLAWLLAWVLVLAGVAAPLPASAQQIPQSFFALSSWYQSNTNPNYPTVSFGALGHAQWPWAEIEPCRDCFENSCTPKGASSSVSCGFDLFDRYVNDAVQHGLVDPVTGAANIAVTFAFTPDWAVQDQSTCTTTTSHAGVMQCTAGPDDPKDWEKFIAKLTSHYNGNPIPRIRIYELWNEANVLDQSGKPKFWSGTSSSAYKKCKKKKDSEFCPMVKLAQIAYPLIHAQGSLLLTPSTAGDRHGSQITDPEPWIKAYLNAGGGQFADGGAYHAYVASSPLTAYVMPEDDSANGSVSLRAADMRKIFDTVPASNPPLQGKPMYQTEGSWGIDTTIKDSNVEVEWLARYYLLQVGLYSSLNLQMVDWFAWDGAPTGPWGVIQNTDAATAYSQVFTWLIGAVMQPCSQSPDSTFTCNMIRGDGTTAQAVWFAPSGKTNSFKPDKSFNQFLSLDGSATPITPGQPLTITNTPILLVGPPPPPPPPPPKKGPPHCQPGQPAPECCALQGGTWANGHCNLI